MSTSMEKISDDELLDSEHSPSSGCLSKDRSLSPVAGDEEGDLDYDETMDAYHHSEARVKDTITEDEDEVKVHATGDIEEGEISSDEEGEIKESDNDSDRSIPKAKKSSLKLAQGKAQQSSENASKSLSKDVESVAASPPSPEDKPAYSARQDERELSDSEESCDSDKNAKKMRAYRSPSPKRSKIVVRKIPTLCRHFLNGKCSWGKECRFLHSDPVEEPPARFLGKPASYDRVSVQFPGPPRGAVHLRGHPRGYPSPPARGFHSGFPPQPSHFGPLHEIPPHFGPLHHEMVHPHGFPPRRGPPPLPPDIPPFKGPGGVAPGPALGSTKTAEVEEESVGWYRLRTITEEWNSDEERKDKDLDLRDVLKRKHPKLDSESISEDDSKVPAPEQWTDPWDRQAKKDTQKAKRKRTKETSRPLGSDVDTDSERELHSKPLTTKSTTNIASSNQKMGASVSLDSSSDSVSDARQKERKKRKLDKSKLKKRRQAEDESLKFSSKHKSGKSRKLAKDTTVPEEKKKKKSKVKSTKHRDSNGSSSADEAKYEHDEAFVPPFPPGPARGKWHHPPHAHPGYIAPYPPHPPADYGPTYAQRGNFAPHNPGWGQVNAGDPHFYPPQQFANRGRRPPIQPPPISQRKGFNSQEIKGQKRLLHQEQAGSSDSGGHSPTPAADSYTSSAETSPDISQYVKRSHPIHTSPPKERSKPVSREKDILKETLSRREKLLQELHAIDKNIQRKKSKKQAR